MAKTIQPPNLVRDEVIELFKNKTFIEYSPLFYESQKSIAQALRVLEIKGRGTINKQFKVFQMNGEYDPDYIQVKVSNKPFQKKILFTHRIVVDFITFHARETGQKFEPTDQEVKLLLEFMNLPGIDNILRKKTKSWFDVLGKLAVSMTFFVNYLEKVGNKTILAKDITTHVKELSTFSNFTKDEQEAYFQDIQKFNKTVGTQIYQLAVKVVNLGIPISFTSKDYCLMGRTAMDAAKWAGNVIFNLWHTVDPNYKQKLRQNLPTVESTLKKSGIEIDLKKIAAAKPKYKRRW